jgi:hypothetical protein
MGAFHLMAYGVTAGVNDANVDMTAVNDVIFTARNNHFIFSEPYELIAAMHMGASVLRVRTNWPSLNNYGRHQLWPVNRAAVPPSYPRIDDYRARRSSSRRTRKWRSRRAATWERRPNWRLFLSGSASRGATTTSRKGRRASPSGQPLPWRRTAFSWSGGGVITLSDNLVGGWYALCGAYCFDVNLRMFRFIFPQYQSGQRRNYRPGSTPPTRSATWKRPTDRLLQREPRSLGCVQHFELPQLEVFGDAAGASTQELRLNLVYLGGGGQLSIPSIG